MPLRTLDNIFQTNLKHVQGNKHNFCMTTNYPLTRHILSKVAPQFLPFYLLSLLFFLASIAFSLHPPSFFYSPHDEQSLFVMYYYHCQYHFTQQHFLLSPYVSGVEANSFQLNL